MCFWVGHNHSPPIVIIIAVFAASNGIAILEASENNQENRLTRARLSLEGLALGDAYGNHHGNNAKKKLAQTWEFSDDTLMACSIVENLRRFGAIRANELAQSFAEHWDGQRGYGQGVTRLLKAIQRGASWQKAAYEMFDGQGSYGNGAAMRVAPLGAFFADDFELLVEQARTSAIVTHAHPEGIAGAIAVAVAAGVAYQLRQENVTNISLADFLNRIIPFVPESEVRRKIVAAMELPPETTVQAAALILGNGRPVHAQLTVPFALWAAGKFLTNYETAIRKTASARGDVDTNCAIVGGIVILYTGMNTVPQTWLNRREPLPAWTLSDS
jgi:ADP-ribosylglycohydrolase